jgi:arsenate reductase-like glutaredoxin family protein
MVLLAGTLTVTNAKAQAGKLPPFRMTQANGKIFKAEDLPMGKPIIIIYFSPECDHCEKLMKELLKRTEEFKKASIAMVTYLPVEKVVEFEKTYVLKKYSNIYAGTENSSFFLKNYYNLIEMPFAALYSKNGDFIKSYHKDIDVKDLLNRLNKLN